MVEEGVPVAEWGEPDWGEIIALLGKWFKLSWGTILDTPFHVLLVQYEWALYYEQMEMFIASMRLF